MNCVIYIDIVWSCDLFKLRWLNLVFVMLCPYDFKTHEIKLNLRTLNYKIECSHLYISDYITPFVSLISWSILCHIFIILFYSMPPRRSRTASSSKKVSCTAHANPKAASQGRSDLLCHILIYVFSICMSDLKPLKMY